MLKTNLHLGTSLGSHRFMPLALTGGRSPASPSTPAMVHSPDGDGDGGGGGGGGEIDLKDPKVVALVDAAVESATTALRKNNGDLKTEKDKLKVRIDALDEKVAAIDGLDVDAIKAFAEKHNAEEYGKMFKEGRFSEVIDLEVQKAVKKIQGDIDTATEATTAATKERDEARTGLKTEKIRNSVAGSVKDLSDGALGDVQQLALNMFDHDDDGAMVLREDSTARTKDGKPVTLDTFNNYLLENRPYYFKGSQGGGGGGGQGGKDGAGPLQILSTDHATIQSKQSDIASGKAIVVDP